MESDDTPAHSAVSWPSSSDEAQEQEWIASWLKENDGLLVVEYQMLMEQKRMRKTSVSQSCDFQWDE